MLIVSNYVLLTQIKADVKSPKFIFVTFIKQLQVNNYGFIESDVA